MPVLVNTSHAFHY